MTNDPIDQTAAELDAAILSVMQELDEVFELMIGIQSSKPEPISEDHFNKLRRIHNALRRQVKTLCAQARAMKGPPAPPPPGGFEDEMEWLPAYPDQAPPTPPNGFDWSVEVVGDYGVIVYTLGQQEAVTPEMLAEDARILALWRSRFNVTNPLSGGPPVK